MYTLPQTLGFISGLFLIVGYIPYVIEVFRGTDKPSRASWLIWSLSTIIILFEVIETGTTEAIWVPIGDALGCFAIFLLSIKYGVGGWSRIDKISFSIAVLSLLVWWATDNVTISLVVNLLIYMSAYISTIEKSLKDPRSESLTAWSFFFIGVVLNVITVAIGTDKGFQVWLYPIILLATVGTLFFILLLGHKKSHL